VATINNWLFTQLSERYIVEESILFVQSLSSELYEWDPFASSFKVAKAVEVKHLSQSALKANLQLVLEFQNLKKDIVQFMIAKFNAKSSMVNKVLQVVQEYSDRFSKQIDYLSYMFNMQNGRYIDDDFSLQGEYGKSPEQIFDTDSRWLCKESVSPSQTVTLKVLVKVLRKYWPMFQYISSFLEYMSRLESQFLSDCDRRNAKPEYKKQKNCFVAIGILDRLFENCQEMDLTPGVEDPMSLLVSSFQPDQRPLPRRQPSLPDVYSGVDRGRTD
jgi:hypothetical protein